MQVSSVMQLCECIILGEGGAEMNFIVTQLSIVFVVGGCFFLGRGRGCCVEVFCLFGFVGLII